LLGFRVGESSAPFLFFFRLLVTDLALAAFQNYINFNDFIYLFLKNASLSGEMLPNFLCAPQNHRAL
jgi:hypothetical protein